ncbi:acyl-CoA thioester hydrolase [Thermomonospora umbrina]|uniref:Acyl-CoA thioester hydrolase n=1 Tax=Thermomonospora umbrina TaxID=111806 RepID=A0A3D9SWT3_9ACTN|nr:acyl-CoA thioester hydrolase [Thermomonospora umbrina]
MAIAPAMGVRLRHRVEHVDTDSCGVVHFSRYNSLMETVVLDLLEEHQAGLTDLAEQDLALAMTELTVRYLRPTHYRDRLTGWAAIVHVGGAQFRAAVTLARQEPDGSTDIAVGRLGFAAVHLRSGRPRPLPATVRRTLKRLSDPSGPDHPDKEPT